jgi:uncharacterized protein YwqG
MDNRQELQELLDELGLNRAAGEIARLARTGWRLTTKRVRDADLPVGTSRIGGLPDLPPGVSWPEWQGLPLAFIAQIRLEDLDDDDNPLPAGGLLSFVYDAEQRTWGFDPADRGSWRVFYFDTAEALVRREPPPDLPSMGRYVPREVIFDRFLSLPTYDQLTERLELREEEHVAYYGLPEAWVEEQVGDGSPHHQLLGHPELIQGDMRLECQMASQGVYMGDGSWRDDPRSEALAEGADDWRLLLQVDSDEGAKMMWGDVGMLYYWIRRQDLAEGAFDRVWMVLQCS